MCVQGSSHGREIAVSFPIYLNGVMYVAPNPKKGENFFTHNQSYSVWAQCPNCKISLEKLRITCVIYELFFCLWKK